MMKRKCLKFWVLEKRVIELYIDNRSLYVIIYNGTEGTTSYGKTFTIHYSQLFTKQLTNNFSLNLQLFFFLKT
jgi:hypothetical protein